MLVSITQINQGWFGLTNLLLHLYVCDPLVCVFSFSFAAAKYKDRGFYGTRKYNDDGSRGDYVYQSFDDFRTTARNSGKGALVVVCHVLGWLNALFIDVLYFCMVFYFFFILLYFLFCLIIFSWLILSGRTIGK